MSPRSNVFIRTIVCLTFLSGLACAASISLADAPLAEETDAKGRTVLRDVDSRVDEERGWFVAAKSTYWPLCYEALDRLEECRDLIGKDNPKELALTLEKSAAWLDLAASAAMTDGEAGIESCSERLKDFAKAIQIGESVPSGEMIGECITLGEICMAKSHILRADAPNLEPVSAPKQSTKPAVKPVSELVRAAQREIREEQIKATFAQYRYDAIQSVRHLTVAQTYMAEAAKHANFTLPESLGAKFVDLTTYSEEDDISGVYDDEVQSRLDEMLLFVEQQRRAVKAKIVEQMETEQ